MEELYKRLKDEFSLKQMKNYIQIKVPLVMWINGGLLELRIKQNKGGYVVYCPTNLFLEANAGGSQEFYFDLFEKNDSDYHYDIKIKNGKFYKEYKNDSNISISINEFIRFFIMLDDFIIKNSVIGKEEEFK